MTETIRAILNPVVIETTVNLVLSGEQTVNSVAVVSGDRVLVKDQTTARDNGVYIVSLGTWSRSSDFNDKLDVELGSLVLVINGPWYELSFQGNLTLGATALTFVLSSLSNLVQTSVAGKNDIQLITASIPRDNTIPQITEGNEVFSINFTPQFALNSLIIEWNISLTNVVTGSDFTVAVFRGSDTNAIGAKLVAIPGLFLLALNSGKIKVNAGSTTLTAYSLRVGVSSAVGTINGSAGSPLLGNIAQSSFSITEVKT